uniref:Uncharacterized protein n=1 Tax=Branchiostoma floridae TaxID=7739 RepID=C3ZXP4_BRAFL|eukprot:XP_002586696.1 hypothetical protein BRAFLDRAFT_105502 [Branchiostoma floridae]
MPGIFAVGGPGAIRIGRPLPHHLADGLVPVMGVVHDLVTKKLAGDVASSASWMTNISNEAGEVLNSVLTTGEGAGLQEVCQGIVKRYTNAHEPPPEVIYVDTHCCNDKGDPKALTYFKPWRCHVKLDIFHYLRRFTKGLTTKHHPLYGTFCSKLSSCLFVWDKADYQLLREAMNQSLDMEYRGRLHGMTYTVSDITRAFKSPLFCTGQAHQWILFLLPPTNINVRMKLTYGRITVALQGKMTLETGEGQDLD